jgi:hypothetical protein
MADAGSARHRASAAAEIRVVIRKAVVIFILPQMQRLALQLLFIQPRSMFVELPSWVVTRPGDFFEVSAASLLQNAHFG